ncbi:MAG: hypothetical protein R3E95_01380 [Thiolinea sp.]
MRGAVDPITLGFIITIGGFIAAGMAANSEQNKEKIQQVQLEKAYVQHSTIADPLRPEAAKMNYTASGKKQ